MNDNPGTLTKILNGINNTLNIANKTIPIVKEATPIINTAKNTITKFKTTGTDIQKLIKLRKLKNQIKKDMNNITIPKTTPSSYNNINNPKFFI